jgi:hypothetical protein
VDHLLTAPRSPTTTGKVERFHRSLRAEFLFAAPAFPTLRMAQGALDEWVAFYNTARPHQGLDMATPEQRFHLPAAAELEHAAAGTPRADLSALAESRTEADWVSRRVASNGVVSVSWQAVSVGKHHAGRRCDVYVTDRLLQFWVGPELVKTVPRRSSGQVRKKRASTTTTNDEECQAGPEGPLSRTSRRLAGAPVRPGETLRTGSAREATDPP